MSVEGQWNVTMDTPLGKQQFNLSFAQASGTWSGKFVSNRAGTTELTAISVAASAVSFQTNVNSPMGPLQMSMNGTVQGDTFNGTCKTSFGDFEFTGVRA